MENENTFSQSAVQSMLRESGYLTSSQAAELAEQLYEKLQAEVARQVAEQTS